MYNSTRLNSASTSQKLPRGISKLSLLSTSIICALLSPAAFAQTSTESTENEESHRKLERIVVTAEKTESSVQEIGMVVNSFSADELLSAGIDDIAGIASLISNVNLIDATGGGVPVLFVRGVGLADFRVNNSPAAAFYDDEIYKPSLAMMASAFFDLERIEVLKGPQGGLYGRNANAGAIQIISAKPTLYGNEGFIDIGYGEYNKLELEGAYNALLTDKLAMRVSGRRVTSDDTYMRSIQSDGAGSFNSQKHGERDEWAARVQFYYEPSDKFDATLKLFAGADKSDTTLLKPIGLWEGSDTMVPGFADGALTSQVCSALLAGYRDDSQCATITGQTPEQLGLRSEYDTASSTMNRLDNEWQGLTLSMNYRLPNDILMTSITHLESFDHARPTDWDAVGGSYQDMYYKSDISVISQEFRLSYNINDWRFFGGVNLAHEELDEDTSILGDMGLIPLGYGHNKVIQKYKQEVDAYAIFE